jgi:hypothetical protein
LAGEIGEERDLFVGERPNFLAKDDDGSDQLVVLEHRHTDCGSNATNLDGLDDQRVAFGIAHRES